ncbi:MAG TPA: hypothetical protein VKZ63_07190 [Kofleriaceae bacterium]|nr:hypothetical protein [Kofleriaceae bacterium]
MSKCRTASSLGGFLVCAALACACATGQSPADGDDDGGGGDTGGPDAGDVTPLPDAGAPPDAMTGGRAVTLTHSASMTITDLNSIACANELTGFTAESSYYRVFNLAAAGITAPLTVAQVSIGIENAISGGGTQPASVRLHALSGAVSTANLTPIGSADITVADSQSLMVVDVPVTGTAPADAQLVVELYLPDGLEVGNTFYPGSNAMGQTGPSYLRSPTCGANDISDIAALGFPDMHLVMAVEGTW